jgi:hypothetical protein
MTIPFPRSLRPPILPQLSRRTLLHPKPTLFLPPGESGQMRISSHGGLFRTNRLIIQCLRRTSYSWQKCGDVLLERVGFGVDMVFTDAIPVSFFADRFPNGSEIEDMWDDGTAVTYPDLLPGIEAMFNFRNETEHGAYIAMVMLGTEARMASVEWTP